MEPTLVLAKTDKGKEEISARTHGLPLPVRHTLILVDGKSTVAQLLQKGSMIPGIANALEALLREGFVRSVEGGAAPAAPPPVSAPSTTKEALIGLAEQVLGGQGEKVVKKLADSGESPAELAAAVDGCHKLIRLAIDRDKAETFHEQAKAILARAG